MNTLKSMVLVSLFVALMCILAPLTLPIGPIPISLTGLILFFYIYLIGWKRSLVVYLIYLMMGVIGLPVFSGFESGVAKLAGPTGGYLVGFVFMTIVSGVLIQIKAKKEWQKKLVGFVGMLIGTIVNYMFGTAWFCFITDTAIWPALMVCVFPFLIGDFIKIVFALSVAPIVAKQIMLPIKNR